MYLLHKMKIIKKLKRLKRKDAEDISRASKFKWGERDGFIHKLHMYLYTWFSYFP